MSDLQIRFSKSLYSEEGVREAAASFAELASITVSTDSADIVVAVEGYEGDEDLLGDELGNHALFETVIRATEREAAEDGE